MSRFYVGQRLSTKGQRCTVRFVGEVHGKQGQWLGVEWDDPTRGKHCGTHEGIEYFKCRSPHPTAASFLRPTAQWDESRTFLEALRAKYVVHDAGEDRLSADGFSQIIRISGKRAEEVGFEKIARQQAQLENLRIVVLDEMLVTAQAESPVDGDKSIAETCPNVSSLDLSRNLFETLEEIASICVQLNSLQSLKLSGNVLRNLGESEDGLGVPLAERFANITSLELDDMLLGSDGLAAILKHFPNLKELSASRNQLVRLGDCTFPSPLTSLTLDDNDFETLEDAIGQFSEGLQSLSLKSNRIATASPRKSAPNNRAPPHFPTSLTSLDLSYNALQTWSLINALPLTLPSLAHLRISHNPLYTTLHAADGAPLTSADGYMLTIARLPTLLTLNYSAISPKDRLNAESYYLSQIAATIALAPPDAEADLIAQHPRWHALCREYGAPLIRRAQPSTVDPSSLAARLLTCSFYCRGDATGSATGTGTATGTATATATGTETVACAAASGAPPTRATPYIVRLPKTLTPYAVLGLVAARLRVSPLELRLLLETGERERAAGAREGGAKLQGVEEWDSSDEEEEQEEGGGKHGGEGEGWVDREVEVCAGTRPLGTFVDDGCEEVWVRIERVAVPQAAVC